jgi:hypothetical protein
MDPRAQALERPALELPDGGSQIAPMSFQSLELLGVVLTNVRRAAEQQPPEAACRFAVVLDLIESAANLLVQQYRTMQFDCFERTKRQPRANTPDRQRLADEAEYERR